MPADLTLNIDHPVPNDSFLEGKKISVDGGGTKRSDEKVGVFIKATKEGQQTIGWDGTLEQDPDGTDYSFEGKLKEGCSLGAWHIEVEVIGRKSGRVIGTRGITVIEETAQPSGTLSEVKPDDGARWEKVEGKGWPVWGLYTFTNCAEENVSVKVASLGATYAAEKYTIQGTPGRWFRYYFDWQPGTSFTVTLLLDTPVGPQVLAEVTHHVTVVQPHPEPPERLIKITTPPGGHTFNLLPNGVVGGPSSELVPVKAEFERLDFLNQPGEAEKYKFRGANLSVNGHKIASIPESDPTSESVEGITTITAGNEGEASYEIVGKVVFEDSSHEQPPGVDPVVVPGGKATIHIRARWPSAPQDLAVTYDDPPKLLADAGISVDPNGQSIPLLASAAGMRGFKELTFASKLNGVDLSVPLAFRQDGNKQVYAGQLAIPANQPPATMNYRLIGIDWWDKGHVPAEGSFYLLDDTPPTIQIITPHDNHVEIVDTFVSPLNPAHLDVKGTVCDTQSGYQAGTLCFYDESNIWQPVGEVHASPGDLTTFDWNFTLTLSSIGFYAIQMEAKDNAGNRGEASRNIEVASTWRPQSLEELLSPSQYLMELLRFVRNQLRQKANEHAPVVNATDLFRIWLRTTSLDCACELRSFGG